MTTLSSHEVPFMSTLRVSSLICECPNICQSADIDILIHMPET